MNQSNVAQVPPTRKGHGFGTLELYLATLSSILGAMLFLRFHWAVGTQGVWMTLLIVLVGHGITIPTAMALSEIATNRKVEGGGAYFMISRTFGPHLGGALGISLYISQTIAIAFFFIAFAKAFTPVFQVIAGGLGFMPDARVVSVPTVLLVSWLVLKRGASIGMVLLYGVVVILVVSLSLFFFGGGWELSRMLDAKTSAGIGGVDWFSAFIICFPAFTGMISGAGLSGDLANPRKSIPLGTLAATLTGMLIYIAVVVKSAVNLPVETLANPDNELVLSSIAVWGPAIPIGLAAATFSSGLSQLLVAPRTLQALCTDGVLPWQGLNRRFAEGIGAENEPRNATFVTVAFALIFVGIGELNLVAGLVSQFYLVTFGSLCLISFLEHFAASPAYRPSFKSRWWISLIGAAGAFVMMFLSGLITALVALAIMVTIYFTMRRSHPEVHDAAVIFKGALYQVIRRLLLWMQKNRSELKGLDWRPSFIAISRNTFSRLAAWDLLRWIARKHGFGTYYHYEEGLLTPENCQVARGKQAKLVALARVSRAGLFSTVIVSPSFTSAVAQVMQVPGVVGMDINGIILEFDGSPDTADASVRDMEKGVSLAVSLNHNVLVIRSANYHFGYKAAIHIWIAEESWENSNLIILLAFIIMGHPEWKDSEISVFTALPSESLEQRREELARLIHHGRIPISLTNVRVLELTTGTSVAELMESHSGGADLVITGFTSEEFEGGGISIFRGCPKIQNLLFVRARTGEVELVEG